MTFSRLVLGEPRLRGKPSGGSVAAPCDELPSYGANILVDPGFELHLNELTGGPEGDEIPGATGGQFAIYSDDSEVQPFGWLASVVNPGIFGRYWAASTAAPRSGTYHARLNMDSSNSALDTAYLIPFKMYPCDENTQMGNGGAVTFHAQPGDYWRVGFWAKATEIAPGSDSQYPSFIWEWQWETLDAFDTGDQYNGSDDLGAVLTTSYQYFEMDGIVPSPSFGGTPPWRYQIWLEFYGGDPSTGTYHIDVDDVEVEVQP